MSALVDHSGKSVVSADVQAGDSPGIGDRFGSRAPRHDHRPGLVDPLVFLGDDSAYGPVWMCAAQKLGKFG